ncbi:ATP phosphoribosyltransferase regulatory subunit [Govanella unica]|uniref:ATP phosphoribosyltransferase regulatory subunit n=1 Tax=Govanella unica TaxID=2975056 RepID=A0A9X3Z897_9PROT|nr:ATP phosphoribosyltransferase regulatory subunit [Govania unica]MDA5194926.1 ATP phosphoribosyltransferase regulatory subunit [Govania unica]
MADYSERALLPEGFHDDLPPEAEGEASVIAALLARFQAYGYGRVAPPLVEFEDSLLAGSGKTQSRQMFRLMDPVSQRMMGIRTDMTIQVARIAATRLAASPRPLRLCYAGQVLLVKGGQIRSERQFGQAGVELIGVGSIEADAEVLLLAADALRAVGVQGLSADLTVPSLVPVLAAELGLPDVAAGQIRAALNAKDIGQLQSIEGRAGEIFRGLLAASGEADAALRALQELQLPAQAAAIVAELQGLVTRVQALSPDLVLTIDPGEFRGFEYKAGIAFTLFAAKGRGELGRGGRYEITRADTGAAEAATGVSLYLDSLMRVATAPDMAAKLYVPHGTAVTLLAGLQDQGYRTVRGLAPEADVRAAARHLGCGYIYADERITLLD